MKPDTMRKIDFFVGVPLTFLLTIFFRLSAVLRSSARITPKLILFIELSEMGSAIVADPAMRKAKEHFNAELFFVIFKGNRKSLKLIGTIPDENIFTMRESNLITLACDIIKFIFWCRRQKIDTVIDLELFSRFSALLTLFSGAREKIGFHAYYSESLYRGNFLTRKVSYNPYLHISKNFIALVNALISDEMELPFSKTVISDEETALPSFSCPEKAKEQMLNRIVRLVPDFDRSTHKLVIINPNSSDLLPQRRWMEDNFVKLIRMILAGDRSCIVVLTGAPGEEAGSESIRKQLNTDRCLDLTGKLLLEELPVLYSLATLMVTNDSGPAHFSSITDMPTFVLYGPETPALYGSLGNCIPIYAGLACSPCVSALNHRKTPCSDNVCLQAITAETVFDKIKPFMES